jgi:hypothetical protein
MDAISAAIINAFHAKKVTFCLRTVFVTNARHFKMDVRSVMIYLVVRGALI